MLVDGQLIRKNASAQILQKCITYEEGEELLLQIHAGTFRAGFYWLTAVADAQNLVRYCKGCQFFSKQIHVPAQELQAIPASWPFSCWGLDMIGPFKKTPGGYLYVYVLIDKFSKWIEYKPLVKATAKKATEFLSEVVHRFGVPNSIITDLGSTFTGSEFWDFCDDFSIKVKYVSVAHPRANGQVERTNGMILDPLRKSLYHDDDTHPGRWLKELPAVIWGLRTQPSRNTGVSPYFMIFGSETMLPDEVAFQSLRVTNHDEEASDQSRETDVDAIEERCLESCARTAKYLASVRRYYNRNVKERLFVVGDLVLKRIQKTDDLHKLSSHWEGPYRVKAVTRPTTYKLCTLDHPPVDLPNSWHIEHLIRLYA